MESIIKEFNYQTAPKSDSIVVLGGGPSTGANKDKINYYIENNNSIVISINYAYPGIKKSDYTYFGNWIQFLKLYNTIVSPNVIVSYFLQKKVKMRLQKDFYIFWQNAFKKHKFYKIGRGDGKKSMKKKKWTINKKGSLKFLPSPSGFAGIVISTLFLPKRILIAGMDGPNNPVKGESLTKPRFSISRQAWRNVAYRSYDHYKQKRNTLKNLVLPLVFKRNISIDCFGDSPLWGLDKKKIGINILN